MDLARIRKLVVASAGLGLLVASSVFGHDLTGAEDQVLAVFDAGVALATAVGVYHVRNAVPAFPGVAPRKDQPGFGPDGQHRI